MLSELSPVERRELRLLIEEFNTAYARVLDEQNVESWPDFFTEDGFYRVTARENAQEDLPVGLVWCEGRAMMRDRAVAIRSTMVFAPRYLRHFNSNVAVLGIDEAGHILSESNYLVLETLMEDETRILQAGMYRDRFERVGDSLLLSARDCIYDSLLIPNDMVFPV